MRPVGARSNHEAAGVLMHYYAWKASTVECNNCKWVGLGAAMTSGESFGDGVDKHCPRCDWRYGFIAYPMSHEFQRAPAQTH